MEREDQTNTIRDEKGDVTTHTGEIKRIIKKYIYNCKFPKDYIDIVIEHEEQGNRDGGNSVPQVKGCLLSKHLQLDLDELK